MNRDDFFFLLLHHLFHVSYICLFLLLSLLLFADCRRTEAIYKSYTHHIFDVDAQHQFRCMWCCVYAKYYARKRNLIVVFVCAKLMSLQRRFIYFRFHCCRVVVAQMLKMAVNGDAFHFLKRKKNGEIVIFTIQHLILCLCCIALPVHTVYCVVRS